MRRQRKRTCKKCKKKVNSVNARRMCAACKTVEDYAKKYSRRCVICEKKCQEVYCCGFCRREGERIYYKGKCANCDKTYLYLDDKDIYCGGDCKRDVSARAHNFFKNSTNIPTVYKVMGFMFSHGAINDYFNSSIQLYADVESLKKVISLLGLNWNVKIPLTNKTKPFSLVRNVYIMAYLETIGFTHNKNLHTFPIILNEYKKYFIQGYINEENCIIEEYDTHNIVTINSPNVYFIMGLNDFVGGVIRTNELKYYSMFKDYDKYYNLSDGIMNCQ